MGYIKANKLQDEANKRNINADAKLEKIFWQASGDHVRDDEAAFRTSESITAADRTEVRRVEKSDLDLKSRTTGHAY